MKIDIHIEEPHENGSPKHLHIKVSNDLPYSWDNQLTHLKNIVAEASANGLSPIICFVKSLGKPDAYQMHELAAVIKAWPVDLSGEVDSAALTLMNLQMFARLLPHNTVVQLSSHCSLTHAQAITKTLPEKTFLRIANLQPLAPEKAFLTMQGLYMHDLLAILALLPLHVGLDIASTCNMQMLKRQLNALSKLSKLRMVQLPSDLTPAQCQLLGRYAQQDAMFLLSRHVSTSVALNIFYVLRERQTVVLHPLTHSALIYEIATALQQTQRHCRLKFHFPYEGFAPSYLDNGSSSHAKSSFKLGLKTHDRVHIPADLNLDLVEPLLSDTSSSGYITCSSFCEPKIAIAIAYKLATTKSSMRLILNSWFMIDWLRKFTRTISEHFVIIVEDNAPAHWLTKLARIMPANRQILLPHKISVASATALVKHLTSNTILIIQGGIPPEILETVAKHVKPPTSIKLLSSVTVEEARIIATHRIHSGVFNINPSGLATTHPNVTAASNFATPSLLTAGRRRTPEYSLASQPYTSSSNAWFTSSVVATMTAETELKQMIDSQQGKFIIQLPVNLIACTKEILYQTFRKLTCTALQLRSDVSPSFAITVAKALPNNVALMLPSTLGAGLDTVITMAESLKPGNSLYVQELTETTRIAVSQLRSQVTLLLDLTSNTLNQQDAITLIKLLRSGHFLGLVATQKQLDSTLLQATYRQCVSNLPQGCILKITADMTLEFILSLKTCLPDGSALLVPKTFPKEAEPTWLRKIAGIITGTRKLILPPGISQEAVDYLINHLPTRPRLFIELPKGLRLSAAQWDKLARPNITVFGTLEFPADMSPSDVQDIRLRLRLLPPLLVSRPIPSNTVSSNQTATLFPPTLPKRAMPGPGTTLSAEPAAKRQANSLLAQQANQAISLPESQSYAYRLPENSSSSSSHLSMSLPLLGSNAEEAQFEYPPIPDFIEPSSSQFPSFGGGSSTVLFSPAPRSDVTVDKRALDNHR